MYGETSDLLTFATVAQKKLFNANLLQKNIFRSDILDTITDADIGSVNSLHALFDLDHMLVKFEQSCIVRNIQNFELFGKKWLTIFEKVLTPFWKRFL